MNKKIRKRYMRKKRILVTGGEGFIGKHLVNRLKEMGHDVITMDLTPSADYEMDMCEIRNFEHIPDVDVIYHLAAQSYGRGSLMNPQRDLDWNAKGTLNVCLFAKDRREHVKKIIYTSTMAVYGDRDLAKETDEVNPLSGYACSKLYGEHCVRRFREYGIDHTIFRVFNTYGPGQDLSNPYKGVVNAFIQQVKRGNKINVTGPLERYRDLTYVDDMVGALLVGLQDDVVNETINACTSTKTTIKELIDTVIETVHSTHAVPKDKFTIENVGGHAGDSFGSTGCNDKLIALGWEPKVSLVEGIDKLWRSI